MQNSTNNLKDRISQLIDNVGGITKAAAICKTSRSSLDNWKNGKGSPHLDKIALLAKAAGSSMDWVAYGKNHIDQDKSLDTQAIIDAVVTVERGLQETNRSMSASKKGQLVLAVYELLQEKDEQKSNNIINLFKSFG